jgi:mono/diheme cytochrome c family protein
LKKPAGFDFWKNTIANGVTNSLMPAFATANGGPLSEAQINSLADYLDKTIPRNSSASPTNP